MPGFTDHTAFVPVALSLADLCGADYADAVCEARAFLSGEPAAELKRQAYDKVDFLPGAYQQRLISLLPAVGTQVRPGAALQSAAGCSTAAFNAATRCDLAPLSALGWYRCGEDGRLYLTSKSEHYHSALGHYFPGYALIERARALGIPNATHNNTRGHITRLLEESLVRAANGGTPENVPGALNCVLNLETGSLAVEAALKMILARFHRMQSNLNLPRHAGLTPVILVMGDEDGGLAGNYHGTTILTQMMRGMWPGFRTQIEGAGAFQVRAIRPNNVNDLDTAFRECHQGATRIAGFFHEIVMMNYGGVLLTRDFLERAYALCAAHGVPTVADEIQSCAWGPKLFLFREYGLRPAFVALGKGFPGGEYPASRIVFRAEMDEDLPQFGALVTNGQEELASLAYLVTLHWAQANAEITRAVGGAYATALRELAARHPGIIAAVEGWGHLSTLFLHDLETAKRLAARLVDRGLDISAQTYKADCPPALLTKLPLIAGHEVVQFMLKRLEEAMMEVATTAGAAT